MSSVSEEGQVFIGERHAHVDDAASLRTETWRTLMTGTQVGGETGKQNDFKVSNSDSE